MQVTAIKTPIIKEHDDLKQIIKENVSNIQEKSVFVITSKIISYCQGRLVEKKSENRAEKHDLIRQEADYYLEPNLSKYDMILAIKNHMLTINAGLDESNANGKYVLWPEDIQQVANEIWQFLRQEYQLKEVGVVITDSRTWPFRWGVVATCLAHCGFRQLNNMIGTKDLFGRLIVMEQVNVAEAIAVAAGLEMGEVAEQTPLALVENISYITFQNRPPSQQELKDLVIEIQDDAYAPLLTSVKWQKNPKKN